MNSVLFGFCANAIPRCVDGLHIEDFLRLLVVKISKKKKNDLNIHNGYNKIS